jgi:hypothetical protein
MGVNQGVQNFLEKMFEPCSMNVLEIEEHNKLGKTSHEHENNKKISTYEHCNAPNQAKIVLIMIHSCVSQGKVFLG